MNLPASLFATRVAAHRTWIHSVLDGPAPVEPPPVLESAGEVSGPYQTQGDAVVDSNARTITVPRPAQNRFYRLNGCDASRITDISISGSNLVLHYE